MEEKSYEILNEKINQISTLSSEIQNIWLQTNSEKNNPNSDIFLQELRLNSDSKIPDPNPKFLRLYGHFLCPDVEHVLLTLAFKKIPYQIISLDLTSRPQWFKEWASKGSVPLLELQNRSDFIPDPIPICFFLEENFNTGISLFPCENPLLRYKIRLAMAKAENFENEFFKVSKDQGKNPEFIQNLRKQLEVLDKMLDENKKYAYFCDQENVTFADLAVLPCFKRLLCWEYTKSRYNAWKLIKPYEFTNLIKWYINMSMLDEVNKNSVSMKYYVEWADLNISSLPLFLSKK